MANTLKCKKCIHYYAIKKPLRRKEGGFKDLNRGHCLDKTVYAKNKPGKQVYPPKAKVKELPFGRHQIFGVRADQVVENCTAAKENPNA